jgi:hypothetical protein
MSYNRIGVPAAKAIQKKPPPRQRGLGWLVATTLLLAVVTVGVWLGREFLLRGVADLWIVSDPGARPGRRSRCAGWRTRNQTLCRS